MEDYSEILSELAGKKKLIVFAGAGIPTASGIPAWMELLKGLKARIGEVDFETDIEECGCPQLAQEIYKSFVQKYGDDGQKEYLSALGQLLTPTNWSHTACQLAILNTFNHIITTDSTFEKAIEAYRDIKGADITYQKSSLPDLDNACFAEHERNLVYLHGHLANNIIFKEDDYDRFYNSDNKTLWDFLKPLYKKSNLVFIGFSFEDPYIRKILKDIYSAIEKEDISNSEFFSYGNKNSCIQHYAFLKDDTIESNEASLKLNKEPNLKTPMPQEQEKRLESKKQNFDLLCRELESIKIKVMKYKEHRDYEQWLTLISRSKKAVSANLTPWSPENE
jgi:hypothetical protein